MSLDDVARITKIQPRILERLEAGKLEGLPAEVFVRGFVRSFARCVGLDEAEALRRHAACAIGSQDLTPTVRALVEVMSELAPGSATAARVTPRSIAAVEAVDTAAATSTSTPACAERVAERRPGARAGTEAGCAAPAAAERAEARAASAAAERPEARAASEAADQPAREVAASERTAGQPAREVAASERTAGQPARETAASDESSRVGTRAVDLDLDVDPTVEVDGSEAVRGRLTPPSTSTQLSLSVEPAADDGSMSNVDGGGNAVRRRQPQRSGATITSTLTARADRRRPVAAGGRPDGGTEPAGAERAADPRSSIEGEAEVEGAELASSLAALAELAGAQDLAAEDPEPVPAEPAVHASPGSDAAADKKRRVRRRRPRAITLVGRTRPGGFGRAPTASRITGEVALATAPEPATDKASDHEPARWSPKMPPFAAPGAPWRRPAYFATAVPAAPSLVIDDADPESAERVLEERAEHQAPRRAFLPPILLDREDRSARQGGLTLAVILLLIAATLTLSYLMRRPSVSGDGMTVRSAPARVG